ncbi:MAG TPA: hypothetical protein VLA17_07065, partial [Candidatus Limnocylindria bacterium]|nr:hypothetical protein [Candidatus Limnocylindria bacterium]
LAQPAPLEPSKQAPIDVVKAYLQAIQARDARSAYRHISFADRIVRDEKTFVRSQENFTGFALDLAKRLAGEIDVWVIERKLSAAKASLAVGYRLPTGDEISSQLYDWNPDKLNALSRAQQEAVLEALEQVKKRGKMISLEGSQTFDLVLEKDGWKISLDWQSHHRVVFKASQPQGAQRAVNFLRNDFLVKNEESFQVDFQVTNRSNRNAVLKLDHLFEPRRLEKNVDMIACGSLLPLRLRPGETQQISSSYLLRGPLPAKSQLAIIYDFRPLPGTAKK